MACCFCLLLLFLFVSTCCVVCQPLTAAEQEGVYRVLEALNAATDWRTLFPDDLCISGPHGVVCDAFETGETHVTELSFGYVSDFSPNPTCDFNASYDSSLLEPFTHLRKLFFYECFTGKDVPFPDLSTGVASELEELVFMRNSKLVGSIEGKISNLISLKKLVLSGNGVSWGKFHGLFNLEQLTLSENNFEGEMEMNIFLNMKKLKVLDLRDNGFTGRVPDTIGGLTDLLKLDLSFNGFSGRIPEFLKNLNNLEFLDLSHNRFGQFGLPLFLSKMLNLKDVYLSNNLLGGEIPEIWENLGGIKGLGLSSMGLTGNIPKSMGSNLKNLCYLGLENNSLEGVIPEEFESLEKLNELNLGNNRLSGKFPFSVTFLSRLGTKLNVEGNVDICIGEGLSSVRVNALGRLKICKQTQLPHNALLQSSPGSCSGSSFMASVSSFSFFFCLQMMHLFA